MKDALKDLLAQLIAYPSITPNDAGCQNFMLDYFSSLGFEHHCFENKPVSNFFTRIGQKAPLLIFAGHTDVVPIGDAHKWHSDPFVLKEQQGMLFGRGVADMKGSLASMMLMAKRFIATYPSFKGSLGFLITSGEEGDDFHLGTPYVMEALSKLGIRPDYCIVGEPSSSLRIADTIKIGRRGSLSAKITLLGKQGHVAYPHLAENPIHTISKALAELSSLVWDNGNDFFPPTTLQITYIHSGGHAGNIIPGEIDLELNFRFSTEQTEDSLKEKLMHCFEKHELKPSITWRLNGAPFLTSKGPLLNASIQAIEQFTGQTPLLSTSGGTSDGRFIAPYGVEVIELGPVNTTIHQVNEAVAWEDLILLEKIYFSVCERLLL